MSHDCNERDGCFSCKNCHRCSAVSHSGKSYSREWLVDCVRLLIQDKEGLMRGLHNWQDSTWAAIKELNKMESELNLPYKTVISGIKDEPIRRVWKLK